MRRWRSVPVLATLVTAMVMPVRAAEKDKKKADDSAAILEQLVEMQKEIKALRDDVAQLRQAVTDLGRARTAPAPPPLPAAVQLDGPALGSATAPVAIVEFSEFQCPFCRRFHDQTLAQIKEQYVDTGKVRYVFRAFPLDMHPQAKPAAIAAQCAARQDAFWKMHDALFANQPRLGPPLFEELAKSLSLDLEAFQACLKQPETAKDVEADVAYGTSVGVTGTPTFFIGRLKDNRLVSPQRISGAQPLAAFASAVDALLK
jgi:protein-disulfide isomerase